ncbi:hypothetical protein Q7P37_000561 [Cladosporium fusiforme]
MSLKSQDAYRSEKSTPGETPRSEAWSPRHIESGLEVAPATEHDLHYGNLSLEGDKIVINQGEKVVITEPGLGSALAHSQHGPEGPEKAKKRKLFGVRRGIFWTLLVGSLLAIALGVGLGIGLGSRESQESSIPTATASSTSSLPSSTPLSDLQEIGGSLDTSYYSRSGAWNGSASARALQNFGDEFDDATNSVWQTVVYYQHFSGEIRWLRQTTNEMEEWQPGPSDRLVVASDAKNSTPLSTVHIFWNRISYWHLFYIDSSNRVRQRSGNNESIGWTEGSLRDADAKAWEGDLIGMTACWGANNSVPIRLFHASSNSTFEEYLWRMTDKTWHWQRSWTDKNGAAGVACQRSGTYRYLGLSNSNNQIEFWYQNNTDTEWSKSNVQIDNVHPASSLGFSGNGVVWQERTSNQLKVAPMTWDAGSTSIGDAYLLPDAYAGTWGTQINAMLSDNKLVRIFYQRNGDDITRLTGNLSSPDRGIDSWVCYSYECGLWFGLCAKPKRGAHRACLPSYNSISTSPLDPPPPRSSPFTSVHTHTRAHDHLTSFQHPHHYSEVCAVPKILWPSQTKARCTVCRPGLGRDAMEEASGSEASSQPQELGAPNDHKQHQEALDSHGSAVPSPPYHSDNWDGQDQSYDSQLEESDTALPTVEQLPVSAASRPQFEDDANSTSAFGMHHSQGPQGMPEFQDFTFARQDRQLLGPARKLGDARLLSPSDELHGMPHSSSVATTEALHETNTSVYPLSYMDTEAALSRSVEADHVISDAPSNNSHYTRADPANDEASTTQDEMFQHQIDEHIDQEDSMEEDPEYFESTQMNSDDVVYIGHGAAPTVKDAPSHIAESISSNRTAEPPSDLEEPKHNPVNGGLAPRPMSGIPNNRSTPRANNMRQSTPRPMLINAQANANPTVGVTDDTAELLEVVAYKFRQKEQSLRSFFSAEKDKTHAELARVQRENEVLHAQVSAVEERCDQSEATIAKYRSQILKAKALQKFLDGLGNDLQGLKRSYDTEQRSFAARIEVSQVEIERLKSALAGKNEYESMLTNSKASLEKLLEGRSFELQAVIQHRDMIQAQLEERVGQLVEERDNRSRLEDLVNELRRTERTSPTAAFDHCMQSVISKLSSLGQRDGQVLLAMSETRKAVHDLAERPSVTTRDYSALTSQLRETELRISQSLSIEATTSTTFVDLSASVASIFQHSIQPLRQQIEHLEGMQKHALSDVGENSALQARLKSSKERTTQLELQLDAITANETHLNKALAQSAARIKELESAPSPLHATRPDEGLVSPLEVEKQVKEAVAEAQQRLSESANTFVAQEKAKLSNNLKKALAERGKAVEEENACTKELTHLRSELAQARSLIPTQASEHARKFDDLTGRYHDLEQKFKAAQKLAEEKNILAAKHTGLVADHDAAKSQLEKQRASLEAQAQQLESYKTSLLQACALKDQTGVDMEVLRSEKDDSINKLRGQLSQAEERSRFAEAGLAQMKSTAEATISQEQDKYRKQREALQHRLNEAQSEIQSKSEEAEHMRRLTEESVKKQQASWQCKYSELELKASESKAAAQAVTATQSPASRGGEYLHREAEAHALEAAMSETIKELRKQHDAALAENASYHAEDQQRQQHDVDQQLRVCEFEEASKTLRQERDAALADLAELQTLRQQQQDQITIGETKLSKPQSTSQAEALRKSTPIIPPKVSEGSTLGKQRRKADRNINTIVNVETLPNRAGVVSSQANKLGEQVEVVIPSQPQSTNSQSIGGSRLQTQNSISTDSDEMLDSYSGRQPPMSSSEARCQGLTVFSNSDVQQTQAEMSQTYTPWLDFSGNPIKSRKRDFATDNASSLSAPKATLNPGFEIFEDSHVSPNDRLLDDRVQEEFTFRKPRPLPNSASKRSMRTASDKSTEGVETSRAAYRTPDINDADYYDQSGRVPLKAQNADGSSPEFMNFPSSKVKRRYSGPNTGPSSAGATERPTPRRPSTPLPDPRLLAITAAAKRPIPNDNEQVQDYPNKKRSIPAGSKATEGKVSDDSFTSRSSQSVSDLPRMQDVNEGRMPNKSRASRMRTSGPSVRSTRSQTKRNKDDSYKARFNQELK